MAEEIRSIQPIPDKPEFPESLVGETGITVHETQPRPLPREVGESSSWLAALRKRLVKIVVRDRKGV